VAAAGGSAGVAAGGGGTGGSVASGGKGGGNPICDGPTPGSGSGGAVGTWEDVTPAEINLTSGGDNFGVQDALADPARPSDFYVFVCHQGVFKSTDYGIGWTKVNTGENGATIDSGKPWGEGIDSNRCRDPETPPTLYSLGSQGSFWKSTDGGVSWKKTDLPEDGKPRTQDGYDVDVDPYDGKHLIVGFHEEGGLAESTDGGDSFKSITFDSGMSAGGSWYGFFIDTGDPVTTAATWLLISQTTGSGVGTWRTTDSGSSWSHVETNEHQHGQSQIYQSGGVVYMAGVYGTQGWGVYRSTDFGATFTHVGSETSQSVVYGTPKAVYAQSSGASQGTIDQSQDQKADASGTTWTTWPLTMTNGPKRAAVSFDGVHSVIVGGNWNAGIWRYVEP
jgi:hypothetical protein